MKKINTDFTVRKHTTPKGQKIYTIYNYFNEKVAQTKSWSRDYVALYICHCQNGKYQVLNRFGRWDLVGKGDSRHFDNATNVFLVKVEES